MKQSPRARKFTNLSDSINRQLNMYALAASAAGVGVLALAQPAEAKIIYTKTHRVIGYNQRYLLDFNRDGITDFILANATSSMSTFDYKLVVFESGSNRIAGMNSNFGGFAYALKAGARVGPALRFSGATMAWSDPAGQYDWHGPWIDVKNRYLGAMFQIKGKTHYAWARLSVKLMPKSGFTATLTGYAYETIPNKPIVAGKTKGKDVVTVQPDVAPGSLGRLASGRK